MRRTSFSRFIATHTGPEHNFSIEHRLFNRVSFFGGIAGIGASIINFIVDASLVVTIGAAIVAVMCFTVFYWSRFRGRFEPGRWIITLLLFVLFSLLFVVNNGSFGPMLYLYMVFLFLILFIWNGKARWFLLVVFIVNISAFFVLELKNPDIIKAYPSEQNRLLDVYLSYFMYIALAGLMLNFAKESYIKERKKSQQADRLKSAFLANMSHEIRTPMNAILGFTQLLNKELTKEVHDSYLSVIRNNSESLLRLIEDIIDISKIEAGELSYHEEVCELQQIINEVIQLAKQSVSSYPEKDIQIVEESPDGQWIVETDRTRLKQVLINLTSNAIKFTERGQILIGYKISGAWIKFYVKDTGIGIPKEYHEEIFERFRKLEHDNSGKIQSGTGIGLSISKNLVGMMGGTIGVDSVQGEGSEFHFTIPAKGAKIANTVSEVDENTSQSEDIDFSNKLILIAEDEQTNFLFLKKVLEMKGASILHGFNGQEAIDIFQQNDEIDLVLMDIKMPGINGLQATAEMKNIRASVPIIAQTAQAMQGDAKEAIGAGCDDYISKPIKVNELLAKISNLL